MVNYTGAIRTTQIPAVGVSWKVKGLLLCAAIGILSWVIFMPILVFSAIAFNGLLSWLGM